MKRLRNLTLHTQSELEIEIAAQSGLVLVVEPEGIVFGSGQAAFDQAVRSLASVMLSCAEAGDCVLAGGHTGLWVAAIAQLLRSGMELPEIFCFDTERKTDERGRFVFVPRGLLRVLMETT